MRLEYAGQKWLGSAQNLKIRRPLNELIFILVSSIAEGEQIRAAITQGVNDYLVKPVDEAVLKRKIVNAYNKKFKH